MRQKITKISYDEFELHVKLLCNMLVGKKFKLIYAIPNGGLLLGVRLHHLLKIPLVTNFYDTALIKNMKNILVCDEICDTGDTLKKYIHKGCTTATLYCRNTSKVKPDYFVEEIRNKNWLEFPWEVQYNVEYI